MIGGGRFGALKAAVVGGTASVIGGGKFANGAIGSAFQYMFNDWLAFDGNKVEHYDDNGKLIDSYPATSGRNGVLDQSIEYQGPIPEGIYTMNFSEISEVSGIRYLIRQTQGDWGHVRARLYPDLSFNDTYGRDNFFLHGGSYPGSAGCIDVGQNDIKLFNSLKGKGTIEIIVSY